MIDKRTWQITLRFVSDYCFEIAERILNHFNSFVSSMTFVLSSRAPLDCKRLSGSLDIEGPEGSSQLTQNPTLEYYFRLYADPSLASVL